MKLSELVAYKNQLDLLSARPAWAEADIKLSKITHTVSTHNVQVDQLSELLLTHKSKIQNDFEQFEKDLNELKKQIDLQIEEAEKPLFQQSYRLYEESINQINSDELYQENIEYVLNRRLEVSDHAHEVYQGRLLRHTDWHYAAMIIHPGQELFVKNMVANDPLYLVDENYDLLKPAIDHFNPLYQNRLRISTVVEKLDTPLLTKIPNEQLGVCLAYNFFNHKPFEIIKLYLTEIYQKLKPGGTLIMTFNDCDRYKAVILVEQFYAAYTRGSMLRSWAEHVGFEETFCYHDDGPSTWIEFRKPGQLTSLRGGQTLAKIVPKPVAESK
jgi:hypothetical protein